MGKQKKEIHRIKRLRFELQWHQDRLAHELGITQAYVSMIERGERRLTLNISEKINKIIKKYL